MRRWRFAINLDTTPTESNQHLCNVCVVTSGGHEAVDSADPRTVGMPRLRSSAENAYAYRTVQRRVDALIRGRADLADLAVAACPEWSVHHTVCHLAGTAQDLVSHNLQNVGTDAWTSAQIGRMAIFSADEVLDLWAETAILVARQFEQSPKLYGAQVVFDALTHEHDIRDAIGEPRRRVEDPDFAVAVGYLTTMLDRAIRRAALPSLRLTTPTVGAVQLGDPNRAPAHIAIDLADFELLRAFGGRRSMRQLLALPWQGDAHDLLPIFNTAFVRPPVNDLRE